jgi:hypothetical protein
MKSSLNGIGKNQSVRLVGVGVGERRAGGGSIVSVGEEAEDEERSFGCMTRKRNTRNESEIDRREMNLNGIEIEI